MDIVANALLELRNRREVQHPDNLQAFILARHALGVMSMDEALDNCEAITEAFLEEANEDDLRDAYQDEIEQEDFIMSFKKAIPKVKTPAGREMEHLLERALLLPIPEKLSQIDDMDAQRIGRVCHVLQSDSKGKKFYLSQECAGRIIGKHRAAGARKLLKLQEKNIIQRLTTGSQGRASYYVCVNFKKHVM